MYRVFDTASLLGDTNEEVFLVKDVIVRGQPGIVAGGKKQLKTGLVVDMALSLALARPWLGFFEVPRPVTTLVMCGESGRSTLRKQALAVLRAKGLEQQDVPNLFWSENMPIFGSPPHIGALAKVLRELDIEVVIIDPMYMCMDGTDAGNLMAQGLLLRSINDVCREHGVTLILVHHTKKSVQNPFEPPELEDIAWAGFQELRAGGYWLAAGRSTNLGAANIGCG